MGVEKMSEEWLTISEASKRVGVSYQAIYKRLNTNLKPYVKKVKGKVLLNSKGLEEFYSTKVQKINSTVQSGVELKEVVDILSDQVEILRNELNQKDEQIKTLHDLLNQSLKNQSQSNFVLAQEQQAKKMIESEEENSKSKQKEIIQPWYKKIFKK